MSNSINNKPAAPQYVKPSVHHAETPQPSTASVAAEAQTSIFQRLPTSALFKPLPALPAGYSALQPSARKKAQPSDFSPPEGDKDPSIENSELPTATTHVVRHKGDQGDSDSSSDERDQAQLMYRRKQDELAQICRPGMSVADAAHAKELAMQVLLCANVATISGTKSTRELSHIIGQMMRKLAQGGTSLPTDTENLLDLLKTQSANLPSFLQKRLAYKDSIAGHLLPLLLLASRRQSPAPPGDNAVMMHQAVA